MEFNQFAELSLEQRRGDELVEYTLTVNYRALNHKELMIRFEFEVHFYAALNCIVGIVSVILVVVFLAYHRVFTRIDPVPAYKFFTYLILTIPAPFIGMFYACIPLTSILGIITILIMGDFFGEVESVYDGKLTYEDKIGIFDEYEDTYSTV